MKARLHIGIVLGALALGVAGPVLAIEIFAGHEPGAQGGRA